MCDLRKHETILIFNKAEIIAEILQEGKTDYKYSNRTSENT